MIINNQTNRQEYNYSPIKNTVTKQENKAELKTLIKVDKPSKEKEITTKTVLIQKTLLKDLEGFVIEYNKTNRPNLKLDYAVYFLSLFNSLPSHYRIQDKQQYYLVRLYSLQLKKVFSEYNKYLTFFIKNDIIEKVLNHSTDKGKSKQYRLTNEYLFDDFLGYEITDTMLLNKLTAPNFDEIVDKDFCNVKRPHLTKYFNENLRIDKNKAFEIMKPYKESEFGKYQSGMQLILEYDRKDWKFSINPDSDNRLHTNLTRTNKELRKCLSYNGEKLSAVDIRASQPFFLAVFLKAVLKKDYDLMRRIGANKLISKEKLNEIFALEINKNEIIDFVQLILNQDFYINFAEHLTIPIDEFGSPYRMKTNYIEPKNKSVSKRKIDFENPKIKETFETKRDYAKSVMMEVLFSSPRTKVKEATEFKRIFPAVYKIMSFIKDECVPLHRLLSHIEAYCLLDYVALRFSKSSKNVPIWSIHNSLVTTKQYVPLLKKETEQLLSEVTTIKLKTIKDIVVIDNW